MESVDSKSLKAVKVEDHPDKVVSFYVEQEEDKDADTPTEKEEKLEAKTEDKEEVEMEKEEKGMDVEEIKTTILEAVKSLLGDEVNKSVEGLKEKLEELTAEVEEIKSTPISINTVVGRDDTVEKEIEDEEDEKRPVFKGVIFNSLGGDVDA